MAAARALTSNSPSLSAAPAARMAPRPIPRVCTRAVPRFASAVLDPPSGRDEVLGRVLAAGVFTLSRDFCAAIGLATMALGHAQASGWCDAAMHDRLLLACTDAAAAWAVWRGAGLNTHVLQQRVNASLSSSGSAHARMHKAASDDADAGAALAALAWGASGPWLTSMVDAQVRSLQIQVLRKDATIMGLQRMLEEGSGGSGK